jgi:hypothetical protein
MIGNAATHVPDEGKRNRAVDRAAIASFTPHAQRVAHVGADATRGEAQWLAALRWQRRWSIAVHRDRLPGRSTDTAAYGASSGLSAEAVMKRFDAPLDADKVASAILAALRGDVATGVHAIAVTGAGVEPLP